MNLKKYVLSSFIHLLPVEETFFFKTKFEKKIKLNKELIYLNYKKHAPYNNPFLTTLIEEKTLYIWFYQTELKSKLIIPESYLMFSFFKEKYPNTLILVESNPNYILIIKDNILVNTYVIDSAETIIEMEMSQYGLSDFKRISQEAYQQSKEEAFNSLGFKELYKWNTLSVDNSNMLPKVVDTVAYPLAFLFFFNMAIELYHLNEVEKKLQEVEAGYSQIKTKNDDIREKINSESLKEEKWRAFVQRELPYDDLISVFGKISKAFESEAFRFTSFSVVGSRVKIDMETKEDFIKGLNILNKIEGLENIALKHTDKKRNRVSYEAMVVSRGLLL